MFLFKQLREQLGLSLRELACLVAELFPVGGASLGPGWWVLRGCQRSHAGPEEGPWPTEEQQGVVGCILAPLLIQSFLNLTVHLISGDRGGHSENLGAAVTLKDRFCSHYAVFYCTASLKVILHSLSLERVLRNLFRLYSFSYIIFSPFYTFGNMKITLCF